MQKDAYPIFPFYLVIDVSGSMDECIGVINDELPELRNQIANDPIVGDIARFAVVTFAEQTSLELPLSDLLEVETMPQLTAYGPTNYGDVFDFLSGCIPHDIAWYKGEGYQMYRPAVFFVTDGLPSYEGWEDKYRALIDENNQYRPNIVSFGFGAADPKVLAQVGTFKAYLAVEGQKPTTVLRTITKELTKSIVASSQRAAEGKSVLAMPDHIDGMNEISIELV